MTNLTNKLFLPVFMLLLSISPALAHNDTFFNSPHRLELKPASFAEPGYRLAKSYWLGGADLDLNFKRDDDDTVCQAKGYITGACKGNETPIKYCGAGNKYHLCGCDASVYRYSALNCPSGSLPNDDICGDYSSGCVCEGAFVWNAYDNNCDFYCSSDYDCPGQVCRTSSGDCVDCVYDSDCGSGQACTGNKCETVDLCENVSCTGGQTCNASTGECECPSGQVLSDGRCEQANCANGGPSCSTGVCDMDSGQCVECTSDSHCGGNKECINNTCQVIDACKNVTCTGGKSCVDGTCVCPSGQLDNNGTCEAPNCTNGGISCSGSTPQCSSSGQCVECTSDSHCANGEKCISNFCQTVDACEGITCVGGKICVNGNCLCPSGQLDNNGTCELPNCANGGITCTGGKECQNKVCVCPSNKPNLSNGVCVECASNSQCSGGKECSGNVCKCPSSKPYLNGGTCAECSINSHCSNGKTCQSGICACPSGQSIFNGICEIPNCVNGGVTCPSGQTCNKTSKLCEAEQRSKCYEAVIAQGYLAAETADDLKQILTLTEDKPIFNNRIYILGAIETDDFKFTADPVLQEQIGNLPLPHMIDLRDSYSALKEGICSYNDIGPSDTSLLNPSLNVTNEFIVQGAITTAMVRLKINKLSLEGISFTNNVTPGGEASTEIENVYNKKPTLGTGTTWNINSGVKINKADFNAELSGGVTIKVVQSGLTINELNLTDPQDSGKLFLTINTTNSSSVHLKKINIQQTGARIVLNNSLLNIYGPVTLGGERSPSGVEGLPLASCNGGETKWRGLDISLNNGSTFYDRSMETGGSAPVLQPGLNLEMLMSDNKSCIKQYSSQYGKIQEFCGLNTGDYYEGRLADWTLFIHYATTRENTSGPVIGSYQCNSWELPFFLNYSSIASSQTFSGTNGCTYYHFNLL